MHDVVCVRPRDERRPAAVEAGVQRGDEPGVRRRDDPEARVARGERAREREGAVGRGVVADDGRPAVLELPLDAPQADGERRFRIEDRQEDGDRRRHRSAAGHAETALADDVLEEADQPWRAGAHELVVDDRLLEHVGALAAILARPAHRDEARLVELPLPRLGRGDPLRLAVLDRAIVPPRARQVGGEPGAEAAAQRLVSGREGEVHDARSHSARRRVRPASEEPAEAVAQVPDAVLDPVEHLLEEGLDVAALTFPDEPRIMNLLTDTAGWRSVRLRGATFRRPRGPVRSRWNAFSTMLRR